jgi:hypothetical protein
MTVVLVKLQADDDQDKVKAVLFVADSEMLHYTFYGGLSSSSEANSPRSIPHLSLSRYLTQTPPCAVRGQ